MTTLELMADRIKVAIDSFTTESVLCKADQDEIRAALEQAELGEAVIKALMGDEWKEEE